jgi:hypothetical protein
MQEPFKSRALRRHVKKAVEQTIGAFDIETDGLFGPYLDGFLKYEDDDLYYRARTMSEMLDHILKRANVILYAHNAKGYEFNYLLDEIRERKIPIDIILQGDNGVIGIIITTEEGRIELRDSLALIPMSLDKAAKAFKTQTQKGDIGLKEGETYDPSSSTHQQYCRDDVQVTIEVVKAKIDTTMNIYGCGIGYTAASTAMAAWKTTIPNGHSYWRLPHHLEVFCREGYYGGFVYPGRDIHIHNDVISIDRNAAYAAAMREGVPVGKARFVSEYEKDKPGMYECKVTANHVDLPCIPRRNKNILEWPLGSFKTIITSMEIDFARKHGYEIEIEEGLVWDKLEYPFDDFVKLCESVERNEPDKKPSVKLDRNALYGKFGSKFEVTEVRFCEEPPDDSGEWIPLVDGETGVINFNLWCKDKVNDAEYINPHWAAWITANERLWMFKTMMLVGMEYVRYGDTDSVKADGFRVRELIKEGKLTISDKYGDCKIDEEYEWFQCLGPKVYHGKLVEGKCKMRAKGIPMRGLSSDLFTDAYKEVFEQVSFPSSHSTFVRMKNPHLPIKKEVSRCITNFRNSATWKVDKEGNVLQPTAN